MLCFINHTLNLSIVIHHYCTGYTADQWGFTDDLLFRYRQYLRQIWRFPTDNWLPNNNNINVTYLTHIFIYI